MSRYRNGEDGSIRRRPVLATLSLSVAVAVLVGCTERLAVPGNCPELCPGGEAVVLDTVLSPVAGGDSSFVGYGLYNDGLTIQLANGGDLGSTVGVVRFLRGSDTVFIADTAYHLALDSVVVQFSLVERDVAATGLVLDFYRLPSSTDSLVSHDQALALMTPDRLLRSVTVPDDVTSSVITMLFEGSDLSRVAFAPADSSRLVVGVKMRANETGVGSYLVGASGGTGAPAWHSYGTIAIEDTALVSQSVSRVTRWQRSLYEDGDLPVHPDVLAVGGPNAARSIIRFELPAAIRDSATIIRATLELIPVAPVAGITDDSLRVDVLGLLADFGAKSSVIASQVGAGWVRAGSDTLRVDIAPIVALWQGEVSLPAAVRVQVGQDYSSLMSPLFGSSRYPVARPRLRLTYRMPFPFGEY